MCMCNIHIYAHIWHTCVCIYIYSYKQSTMLHLIFYMRQVGCNKTIINPIQILIEVCDACKLPFLSQELRQKWIKILSNLKQVPSLNSDLIY